MANDRDDFELEFLDELAPRERWILLGLFIAAIAVIGLLFLDVGSWGIWSGDFVPGDLPDFGFESNRALYLTIILSLALLGVLGAWVYFGSDEEGDEEDQLSPATLGLVVLTIVIGIVLVNSNIPALGYYSDASVYQAAVCPPQYPILYDEPQPFGYGNCGVENEGILTDAEGGLLGAALGCAAGGAAFALIGAIPVVGWAAVAGGCLAGGVAGAGAGYAFSASDLDGDPTTGW